MNQVQKRSLGSARAPRAPFGASPKDLFAWPFNGAPFPEGVPRSREVDTKIMATVRMIGRFRSLELIEREVELENIDSELTENAEVPALGVLPNQLADCLFT